MVEVLGICVGLCKSDIVATIDDVRQYCLCKNNNKSPDHHSHVRIGQTVVFSNPKAGTDGTNISCRLDAAD
jgi:chemotaxis receptor (MCP) glutamine deamidase CheD